MRKRTVYPISPKDRKNDNQKPKTQGYLSDGSKSIRFLHFPEPAVTKCSFFCLNSLPAPCFCLWNYNCLHTSLWRHSWAGIKRRLFKSLREPNTPMTIYTQAWCYWCRLSQRNIIKNTLLLNSYQINNGNKLCCIPFNRLWLSLWNSTRGSNTLQLSRYKGFPATNHNVWVID